MFGKLSWDAIPFDQPIALVASGVVLAGLLAVAAFTFWKGWWPYLWREWITTLSPPLSVAVRVAVPVTQLWLEPLSRAVNVVSAQPGVPAAKRRTGCAAWKWAPTTM